MVSFKNSQTLGREAENAACKYLKAQGFVLLQSNYRCRFGEIDLIMRDQEMIVFVEVRSRSRTDYGSALESIDNRKITKLSKTATHFLQMKKWLYKVQSRFDVVAIQSETGTIQLEWIKNAFAIESY